MLGRLLADVVPRDEVLVATKAVGRTGPGPMQQGSSRGHLLSALDASLRRLGVDHVDLWQLHSWDDLTPWEESMAALDAAVTSGKARYVGVSNFGGWQMGAGRGLAAALPGARRWCRTSWSTPCCSATSSARSSPAAEALGLGILPWSPLGRGVLTGKYRNGSPADSRGASDGWGRLDRAATSTTGPRDRRRGADRG